MKAFLPVAAIVLVPSAVLAASPFDGTWKINTGHVQLSKTPYVYAIDGSTYTCSTCTPPYTVKADGTDQKVTGHDFDTVAVTLTPTSTLVVTKLKGKELSRTKTVLGSDPKTAKVESTYYNGTEPVTIKLREKQVDAGAAGSHALSGSWIDTKVESVTDAGITETLAMTDDGFSLTSNGQSYEAKFDGKKYPVKGDVTGTEVMLKKVSDTEVVESDYDKGKLVETLRIAVSKDGKTLHLTDSQLLTKRVQRYTADKQ